MLNQLCPPALIYLIFSITQIVIDTVKGLYNTALIKVWVAIIFTVLLNYLCQLGLGIISWFIVFIPFILMTLIVGILLLMFGLDPTTGKMRVKDPDHKHHKHGHHAKKHDHHPPEPPDDPVGDDDDMLKVFSPYDYKIDGGGGGGSTSGDGDDEEEEDYNKKKTKKILSKSLLFYSEDVEDDAKRASKNGKSKSNNDTDNAADFKNDEDHLDVTKVRVDVENVTNILYGMGKVVLAKDFNDRTISCIDDTKRMKKESRKKAITYCFNNNIDKISMALNIEERKKFKTNVRERLCQLNEAFENCKKRVQSNWWK